MSYTDDFFKGLNKRNVSVSGEGSNEYTSKILEEQKKRKQKRKEDDIAPVRTTTSKKTASALDRFNSAVKMANAHKNRGSDSDDDGTWFKGGAFSDGSWDKGDLTKTILGTAGDFSLGVLSGVGNFAEGVGDVINYGIAGVADLVGADDFAKSLKEEAQTSVVDKLLGDTIKTVDESSVLGDKADSVSQGIGYMLPMMAVGGELSSAGVGTSGVNAATTGMMATSGMGSGMSEAYQGGATDKEAITYGAISAASEVLSEKFFGGLGKTVNATGFGKGLSSADDMLAKKVSNMFSSQIAKNLAEFGIKAGAEGFEEVISGIAQAGGKKLTYMSEEDFWEILKNENLLEQFISGAVTSGFMQAGDVHIANKTKTDFITGLTENEQKVVDKEVENRIAAQEENGEKVTNKEKSKIYDKVVADLDKGYISIDTIESVLGGDTYKAYKDTIDKEDALIKGFEELGKKTNATLEEQDRYAELKKQVQELKSKSQRSQLKSQLGEEVFNLAKDSRLAESYNEKSRRGQSFEADLSKYDTKQQEVIKKAVESGVLNNTNRTHEFVDMIAKISADKGVLFDFINNEKLKNSGFAIEGKTVNGYKTEDGNVALNIQSHKALESVVGHEITHILEGTELYSALQEAVKQYATTKGEYAARMQSLRELYTGVYKGADFDTKLQAELTADIVGDYLFSDSDFINSLSTEQPNLFKKIYNEIKYLCKVATAGSKEARELEKVKKAFDNAWKGSGTVQKNTAESGVKYDINLSFDKNTDITYDSLISKPDMVISEVTTSFEDVSQLSRDDVIEKAKEKLSSKKNSKGVITLHNTDTGEDIVIGKPGLSHGLRHDYEYTAMVTLNLESYLENAIKINEAVADKNRNHDSDILLGYGETATGERIPAYFVVSKLTTGKSELIEFGSLYSINAKKIAEDSTQGSPGFQSRTSATISISELLDIVNNSYSDILPQSVADHYGIQRRSTKLGGSVKYSLSEETDYSRVSQMQIEVNQLRERIRQIEESDDFKAQIDNLSKAVDNDNAVEGIKAYQKWKEESGYAALVDRKDALQVELDNLRKKAQDDYLNKAVEEEKNAIAKSGLSEADYFRKQAVKEFGYTPYFYDAGYIIPNGKMLNFSGEKGKHFGSRGQDHRGISTIYAETSGTDALVRFMKDGNIRIMAESPGIDISTTVEPTKEQYSTIRRFIYEYIDKEYFNIDFTDESGKVIGSLEYENRINPTRILNDIKHFYATGEIRGQSDIEKYLYSLSKEGEQPTENGRFYGKDMMLEKADDILPVREDIQKKADVLSDDLPIRSDLAPTVSKTEKVKNVHANDIEFEEYPITEVKTNRGVIPIKEYRDIIARQSGYDDYADMRKHGVRFGDQYDADYVPLAPTRKKVSEQEWQDYYDMLGNDETTTASVEQNDIVPIMEELTDTKIDDTTLKGIGQRLRETLSLTTKETKAIQEVVQKYSTTEIPNNEQLFKEIKEKFGEKNWTERNEEIADIKKIIKGFQIKVSDTIKSDITDYGDWKKSQFGKLRLSKDGLPVDDIYMGLSVSYPQFFPADIVNPTDQLLAMAEVMSMDTNVTETFELDDDTIQQATDIVISEVNKYKENELTQYLAEEQSHFYKEVIANDDLAGKRAQLNEWYENRKAELHKELDDRNAFVSNRAKGFYNELNNLKKGVRASQELGYFLDFGFNWSELKSTLLQVSKWPDEVIRPGSNVESIVREAIGREYEDRLYDLDDLDTEYKKKLEALENPVKSPIQTVKERLNAKLENVRKELLMNQQLRDDFLADFEKEISRLQAEYNAKRDKNTKVANNILRRIERLQRMKNDVAADYQKRINDLESTRDKLNSELEEGKSATEQGAMRRELHESKLDNIKTRFAEKGFDFDEVLKNAKNLSTIATVDNTPQRVMEKALGYKQGQILADETVNKVAQNESEGIKWLNSFTDRKNGLLAQISKEYHIKPGSKKSAAAQMYAEGFYVNENNEIIKYGDSELAIDFPDATERQNIIGLATDPRIRQIYDETLDAINESRARNAYPEIKKLDNYFLHFRAMEDTFSRLGLPFNPNDIKAKDLPTDLNGVTADLKPGQPYFASAMHRTGKRTSFDLLGGLEKYLSSAKNQIYHIDDIQTLRALRNYIADTYGQAQGLEGLDSLSEEEAQERIKQVYDSHLSTFAKFLNEEANVIAGKTALIDRGLEGIIGRRGIQVLDTINKQVGSNMVGANISSGLTNLVSVMQSIAKTQKRDCLKAFAQMSSNKISSLFGKSDGFAESNPGIIRRKGAEKFARTPYEKAKDKGYLFAGAVDNVATEFIVRTKFNEYTRKGMSEEQGHVEADKWASRLLGDRSLGQLPQLYNSKMLGLFTKFQLEVRNQLDTQFYDTIQEAKVSNEGIENALEKNAKTAAKVGSTFFQLAVLQHLFGKAFESVAGYNPAFDIIDVLMKTFGFDDDEEDEDTALDNLEQGFLALLEDLPYTSTLTGGRIPISSALPIKELVTGKDDYGTEKSRVKILGETLPYYILPGGYGQIKKTAQGLKMFDDKLPVAGSYTDSGNLRFPVEDTFGNRVQAAVFGQYANKNARAYFDNDILPLKEKQIKEYAEVELPIADYWKVREDLKDFSKQDEKVKYINGLDITEKQKNVLKSYLYDEEGYKEENPEKYAFLESEGIGFLGYKELDDETQDSWSWAFKHQDEYRHLKENGVYPEDYSVYRVPMLDFKDEGNKAYSWSFDNPEKATLGKVFGNGVKEYRQYAIGMNNIKADKDSNGNSISGSKKQKVLDYINNLDIDYGAKCILLKSEYKTEDNYNTAIVDYLNARDDISREEMITILEELGATIDENGYIYWN